MIEALGLTKRYGDVLAVDDLSFTVQPGKVTGFLGPNGSGKTTTTRMFLGLDRPTAGTVTVNGRRYVDLPVPLREVGAMLDARAAHPRRTAYDHLRCLARSNGIDRRRAHAVLELVGLDGAANGRAGTFSLGMAQRLGITTALLGEPGVLILDEPCAQSPAEDPMDLTHRRIRQGPTTMRATCTSACTALSRPGRTTRSPDVLVALM